MALVCRRLVEIAEDHHHVANTEAPFVFCPACGEALRLAGSEDVYMRGLRCENRHEFWLRGDTVRFTTGGGRSNLSTELGDLSLPRLLEYWLGDSPWVTPYVHPQLRASLQRSA